MEADPEVVQKAAQLEFVFETIESSLPTDVQKLVDPDVVAAVDFQHLTHGLPRLRQRCTDMRKTLERVAEDLLEVVEPAIGGEIGPHHRLQIREAPPQPVLVEIAAAILLFVLYDDERAVVTEQFDDVHPVVEVGVLTPAICNQGVERSPGQEELVGRVIDLLSTEVPHVHPKSLATVRRPPSDWTSMCVEYTQSSTLIPLVEGSIVSSA